MKALRFSVIVLISLLCVFLFFIGCRKVYWDLLKAPELKQTMLSAEPLILAIKEYEKKNSKSPKELNDLIPDFIKSIPKPEGPAEGFWEYWSDDNEHYGKWHNQPKALSAGNWALGIAVKKGFIPRLFYDLGDYFVYHPSGTHNNKAYGGSLIYEFDGWGYYYE